MGEGAENTRATQQPVAMCTSCGRECASPVGGEPVLCENCGTLQPLNENLKLDSIEDHQNAFGFRSLHYRWPEHVDANWLETNYISDDQVWESCGQVFWYPPTVDKVCRFLQMWAATDKLMVPGEYEPTNTYEYRVGPVKGLYFAAGNVSKAAITLVGALLFDKGLLSAPGAVGNFVRLDCRFRPRLLPILKLLKGIDCDIFETIHAECLRQVVVNYDALKDRRFRDAYGSAPGPTSTEITELLGDLYTPAEIDLALARLNGDNIIRQDPDGTWHITF